MENTQLPKQELSEREILISVNLQTSHVPRVFDLSASQPFEVFFEIKRGNTGDEGRLPLTFSTASSIFDGAYAISSGLVKLIDREDDSVIDLRNIDKTNWSSKATRSIKPSPVDGFITIAPRPIIPPPVKVARRYDHELFLGLPTNIKDYLKAGHNYRLQLATRDLNIQWWAWGSASELALTSSTTLETLPPHAAGKIVASHLTHRDFGVVESFPNPPTLIIKLTPTTPPRTPNIATITRGDEHREGNGKEKPEIQQQQAIIDQLSVSVTVINTSAQVITVKSALRQHYICPVDEDHPFGRIQDDDRVTSTHRKPSIKNFSIIDSSTSEELNPTWITASAVPEGYNSPKYFTTLKPGVPVSTVVKFPERYTTMMQGKRCILKLRSSGVAWIEGDTDQLFKEANERGEKGLWMNFKRNIRPPLLLECEDQLVYELPAKIAGN